MEIEAFYDPATGTVTYLVWDRATGDAVLIDPILDFDPRSMSFSTPSVDAVLQTVRDRELTLHAVLDTHLHADHFSAADRVRRALSVPAGTGSAVPVVQALVRDRYNLELAIDGSQWDLLMGPDTPLKAGALTVEALHTPGHTPSCATYRIRDALFTGDALFMPDFGTGRCDFPGGSAAQLFDSVQALYALPDATRVFIGHDYGPGGRPPAWETTIGACKTDNVQLGAETSREAFVAWRSARDATLPPPALLWLVLQVNAVAGRLPEPESNGVRYLKLPVVGPTAQG